MSSMSINDHIQAVEAATTGQADFLKSIKTVYVSPTKTSLADFTLICSSPYFQHHIEHVIFIPRVGCGASQAWYEEKMCNDFEKTISHSDLSAEEMQHAFEIFDQVTMEYEFGIEDFDDPDSMGCMVMAISQELREGLKQLPKLNAMSIQNLINHPGVNAMPLWFSESLLEEYALKGLAGVRETAAGVAVTDYLREVHVGVVRCDTIFGALSPMLESLKMLGKIKSLTLGDRKFSSLHQGQIDTDVEFEDLEAVFGNLTKLSVSSGTFSSHGAIADFWQNVAHCATNLEELVIFEDSAYEEEDETSVTSTVLTVGNFANLAKLHLYDNQKKCGIVNAQDFLDFTQRHRDELREVVLQGIMLAMCNEDEELLDTMYHCLWQIKEQMQLSKFEMQLYRRDEHDDFGECTNGGFEACDESCESYIMPFQYLHRCEIAHLAQQLNVFQHARGWNFGDYVMNPDSAIGSLLKACEGQVGGGRDADVVESESESAVENGWESPVGGDDGYDMDMEWDSDETMY
ncbi:uncharacterized protein RCC_02039 [Ramularia collo-cygni]|uniref:Uncharacterized protein n=1 Tax=Ramularia collo-cygni TaxID=112498 RepID=A0A2D3UVP5_9PEZI|nr:uncharacterized protein RCC_02039 [Ramularia collo-cygni]CZT16197.1 uncharacterized protein RCC_02039 [Ramularia collo-cygni]